MSYETPIHTIPSRCTLKFHPRQHIHSKATVCSVVMCASDIRNITVGADSKEILNERMSLLTQGFVGMISDSLCFRVQKKLCQSFLKRFPLFIGLSLRRHPKVAQKNNPKIFIDMVAALSFQYTLVFVGHKQSQRHKRRLSNPWKGALSLKALWGISKGSHYIKMYSNNRA